MGMGGSEMAGWECNGSVPSRLHRIFTISTVKSATLKISTSALVPGVSDLYVCIVKY